MAPRREAAATQLGGLGSTVKSPAALGAKPRESIFNNFKHRKQVASCNDFGSFLSD